MPTYEYACSACGNEWEQAQRITEAPVDVCPVCGKSTAHRLISRGTNFILKGGGWYSDLYSSPKPSADAAKPATEGAERKSETEQKSEKPAPSSSEPASKPATKPAQTESAVPSPSKSSGTSSGTSSAPTS